MAGVVEFATSVVFATDINNTDGNLLLMSFITMANLPPDVLHFKMTLMLFLGAWGGR